MEANQKKNSFLFTVKIQWYGFSYGNVQSKPCVVCVGAKVRDHPGLCHVFGPFFLFWDFDACLDSLVVFDSG